MFEVVLLTGIVVVCALFAALFWLLDAANELNCRREAELHYRKCRREAGLD